MYSNAATPRWRILCRVKPPSRSNLHCLRPLSPASWVTCTSGEPPPCSNWALLGIATRADMGGAVWDIEVFFTLWPLQPKTAAPYLYLYKCWSLGGFCKNLSELVWALIGCQGLGVVLSRGFGGFFRLPYLSHVSFESIHKKQSVDWCDLRMLKFLFRSNSICKCTSEIHTVEYSH